MLKVWKLSLGSEGKDICNNMNINGYHSGTYYVSDSVLSTLIMNVYLILTMTL